MYPTSEQIETIINELSLWCSLAVDHPDFLLKQLPNQISSTVERKNFFSFQTSFQLIYQKVIELNEKKVLFINQKTQSFRVLTLIKLIIQNFNQLNVQFVNYLKQLKTIKDNNDYLTLLDHLIKEHNYMIRIFTDREQELMFLSI